MRIGNLELKNPFIAAPLAGVTDAPTRTLAAQMGAALTYSEMISAKGLVYGNKNTEELLFIGPDEGPVVYQIFGHEPDIIEEAVMMLASRGADGSAPGPVAIDINMGCPVPKIVKNGEGSALMRDPKLAGEIVRAAVAGACRSSHILPITVKMRLGFDDDHINAVEVAKICEDAGASAIAVHGRTRAQYYSGAADRDAIGDVCRSVGIPVIASGDIFSECDALAVMDRAGAAGVMIARGALGDPWIYARCAAALEGRPIPPRPGIDEVYAAMRRHFHMLTEYKGEKRAVFEMRKQVCWYLKGRTHANEVRRRVNTITTVDEMKELLSET